jgi:hypothetical protein
VHKIKGDRLNGRYWCNAVALNDMKGMLPHSDLKKAKKNGKGIKWYRPTKLHAAFREWGLLKSTLALYLSLTSMSSVMSLNIVS